MKGLLKKIFSFGRKKEPEPQEDAAQITDAAAEAEAAEAAKAAEEAAKKAAEEAEQAEIAEAEAEATRLQAEEEAKAAEVAAKEATAKAEAAAAEQEATEAAKKAQEEAKAAERRTAEAKAEAEKQAAEAKARKLAEQAEAETQRLEEERKEQARAEEQREKEEREAQEKTEQERLEQERLEQERAEQEAAEQEAAEKEAAEKAALELQEQQEAERLAAEEQAQPEPEPESEVEDEPDQDAPSQDAPDEPDPPVKKRSFFQRMKEGLSRSSNALSENITSVFKKKKLDEDTLQDLEDILIQADLGVDTAMAITDSLASQRMGKDVSDEEVRQIMAQEIEKVLAPVAQPLELDLDHSPHVILVIGVNGSGKTTTIGKLSQKLYDAGFSTLLVAGDTFRAAAIEQLKIWGDRTQSTVAFRKLGSDSAGLVYDAYELAVEQKRDVMLIDTAGRLQNKTELMDELAKIVRVLKKHDDAAPHTILLTLDATTGQNAMNQVEIFKDVAGVNGLIMTKLDGTARGGILVSISAKYKLPVYFIGVGEQVDDLEPFEADEFAKVIAGLQ